VLPKALIAIAIFVVAAAWEANASGFTQGEGPTYWSRVVAWIVGQQRAFHLELTEGLKTLSAGGGAGAAWGLIVASFLYGIFHAAGPGHGKAVLTTYLLTHKRRLGRGVALATAAAFCQGLVAVLLVYGLIFAASWLPRETSQAVTWSERLSYALVALLGTFLLVRAARHGYAAIRAANGNKPLTCSHSHGPSAEQIEGAGDLKASVGVVLSVGLRPCTGAVLVLVFAKVTDLVMAGIAAVAAMSAGTALAVSALAFATVSLRQWVAASTPERGVFWHLSGDLAGLAGGTILVAIGVSLFSASFATSHPLGL